MKFIPMMIWMAWLSLKRDKVALMLTFLLPIVFFSIFVGIFGGMMTGGGSTNSVKVAVVDDDQSESSKRFVQALVNEGGLRVRLAPANRADQLYSRAEVETLIRDGDISVGLIIPKGFGETFPSFNFGSSDGSDDTGTIELLTDKQRDPVGHQMVAGLMQKAAMMGAPDLLIERGLDQFDKFGGGMTQQQRDAMDRFLPMLRAQTTTTAPATQPAANLGEPASGAFDGLVRVKIVGVQGDHKSDWEAFVSFQVAQTAVMFLLFSMAGAAGSLLEEQENGTLERVLSSNVGMTGLLIGKWFVIALIGLLQLTIMFLWAQVFGLTLFTAHHLAGFLIMSIVTAAAGSAFGMLLATACRSRGQLAGLSTIIILIMSAVGGSMFPRFLMSDTLKTIGLGTFNGWALDGYTKVFYDQLPLWRLWPQVLVLAGITVLFMFVARQLARRWESV